MGSESLAAGDAARVYLALTGLVFLNFLKVSWASVFSGMCKQCWVNSLKFKP